MHVTRGQLAEKRREIVQSWEALERHYEDNGAMIDDKYRLLRKNVERLQGEYDRMFLNWHLTTIREMDEMRKKISLPN